MKSRLSPARTSNVYVVNKYLYRYILTLTKFPTQLKYTYSKGLVHTHIHMQTHVPLNLVLESITVAHMPTH